MAQSKQQTGQLLASSGLRKMVGPPGSSFEIIVIDWQGRPVSHLSE